MLTRRKLIKVFCGGALVYHAMDNRVILAATAGKDEIASFTTLSKFLTGHESLDPHLASGFLEGLKKAYPQSTIDQLLALKANSKVEDILTQKDSLGSSVEGTISLWYLGYWSGRRGEEIPQIKLNVGAYMNALAWKTIGVSPPGIPDNTHWSKPLN